MRRRKNDQYTCVCDGLQEGRRLHDEWSHCDYHYRCSPRLWHDRLISPGTSRSTFSARTRRISLINSRDRGRTSSPTSRRVALGFPRSHDVYGDGAIVCVPAPGHTPGSIIVFVALPNNVRYALVGDLVWQREGLTNLEERPLLSRLSADLDGRAAERDHQRPDPMSGDPVDETPSRGIMTAPNRASGKVK